MGTRFPTGMAKRYVTKQNDRDYLRHFLGAAASQKSCNLHRISKKHQKMNSADNEAIQN